MVQPLIGRAVGATAVVLLATALACPVLAQSEPSAPLVACDQGAGVFDQCLLPAWPTDGAAALPSVFGSLEPGVWLADPSGDAPPGGLDVLGIGIARVPIGDAASLRRAGDILRLGNRRQAVQDGEAVLIRTVLASAPEAIVDGHAGVFVATDVDGVRSNDAPTGVDAADGPFAGLQEVYSLNIAAGEEPDLLYSDLSRGWYKGREAFAAHRPAPEVIDILVRPERFGEALRVASFAASPSGGGYDVVGIGPTLAPIPIDGVVATVPTCLEASVSTEPFVVERLIENGETFRDIETPRSWSATARFTLTDEERSALEALIAAGDADADGSIDLIGEVVLVEEGLNVRQTPRLSLRLAEGEAAIGVQVGLARRGFIVVRDLEIEPTVDGAADAFLTRAADALVAAMPPFRVARKGGAVLTSASAPCLPPTAPEST